MDSELLRLVCALAAFGVPLGFAWFIVWWQGRRQTRRVRQARRTHD
ncbi:hypothetical protein [Polaromonas sp. UC242_47]